MLTAGASLISQFNAQVNTPDVYINAEVWRGLSSLGISLPVASVANEDISYPPAVFVGSSYLHVATMSYDTSRFYLRYQSFALDNIPTSANPYFTANTVAGFTVTAGVATGLFTNAPVFYDEGTKLYIYYALHVAANNNTSQGVTLNIYQSEVDYDGQNFGTSLVLRPFHSTSSQAGGVYINGINRIGSELFLAAGVGPVTATGPASPMDIYLHKSIITSTFSGLTRINTVRFRTTLGDMGLAYLNVIGRSPYSYIVYSGVTATTTTRGLAYPTSSYDPLEFYVILANSSPRFDYLFNRRKIYSARGVKGEATVYGLGLNTYSEYPAVSWTYQYGKMNRSKYVPGTGYVAELNGLHYRVNAKMNVPMEITGETTISFPDFLVSGPVGMGYHGSSGIEFSFMALRDVDSGSLYTVPNAYVNVYKYMGVTSMNLEYYSNSNNNAFNLRVANRNAS